MKILFLTNIPSPYRVDFFNELGKSSDLTVLFEKATSDERDLSWKEYRFESFKGVFLKGISISTDSAVCVGLKKYLSDKSFDKIICSNFSSPTGISAIFYMKRKDIPYFLEADGGVAKKGKGFKEHLKRKIISGAKGYFSTSKPCDDYFIAYGAKKENIYRYPFTSLNASDILDKPLSLPKKQRIRKKLKIEESSVVVSVGRFSYMRGYGKGYDTLFKVCETLPKNIGIYIIGDEPTDEFVKWKNDKNLDRLHFVPFKLKSELFEYYRAADVSVLLSRGEAWGLVINESMANGTPVIATDACVGALELIKDGVNGYIVSVDSPEQVKNRIADFLTSKDKQKTMPLAAIETIKNFTIEKMSISHINSLKEIFGA